MSLPFYFTPPVDPTNPDLMLNLRSYLNTVGLVRSPDDSSSNYPPCWVQPRYGTPAPNELTEGGAAVEIGDPVIGLFWATGIPSPPYEGFIRNDAVTIIIRASTPQPAIAFDQNVRVALNDRRGWNMGAVFLDQSILFRALSLVDSSEQGFTFSCEYLFSTWGTLSLVEG